VSVGSTSFSHFLRAFAENEHKLVVDIAKDLTRTIDGKTRPRAETTEEPTAIVVAVTVFESNAEATAALSLTRCADTVAEDVPAATAAVFLIAPTVAATLSCGNTTVDADAVLYPSVSTADVAETVDALSRTRDALAAKADDDDTALLAFLVISALAVVVAIAETTADASCTVPS